MNKKHSNIRKSREPEHFHIMFHANVGTIVGLLPMTLHLCEMFVDYDLSLITDLTFLYLGVLCLLLSYFTRYLTNQLEHITDLYYNSDRWKNTGKAAEQSPESEKPNNQ